MSGRGMNLREYSARLMTDIGHDARSRADAAAFTPGFHIIRAPRAPIAMQDPIDPTPAADAPPRTAMQGGDRPWPGGRYGGAIPITSQREET